MNAGRPFPLTIDALGGLGDGIGTTGGARLHVPFTLPGDTLQAQPDGEGRAVMTELLSPSSQRRIPPCVHFGICGGCTLQHADDDTYRAFKQELLMRHLRTVDDAPAPGFTPAGGSGRRRVEFGVAVAGGELRLGYRQARSHELVALTMCPVASPAIQAVIAPLQTMLAALRKPGRLLSVAVSEIDGGLDVVIETKAALLPRDRDALIAGGNESGWRRLVLRGADDDVLFDHGATVTLGSVAVAFPPRAFLQATKDGENAIVQEMLAGVGDAEQVIDLYGGLGTYTLPLLAAGRRVSAYEGDPLLTQALWNAARAAGFEAWLDVQTRDLMREPLTATMLAAAGAVVINPPRNGAGPQVEQIARSGVARVVMVSCHPATFMRDAARLLSAGYRLERIAGIDQFRWTAHLELVGVFVR